jgi:hypothetical protein
MFEEYPKMVYLHPPDKTQKHTIAVVKNPDEENAKLDAGYQKNPHLPLIAPTVVGIEPIPVFIVENPAIVAERIAEEAAGSGTGRWPDGTDNWTQTSDGTDYPVESYGTGLESAEVQTQE